ncbi:hypothetical protein HUG10_02295 [Halorarum halophilum]|uniref:Uncharacterized protein n=1 Tax=Halorarum halophilum TaxID=2743090 RepID=A0A7D5K657_9EURY|nr:hypothetical protein [Halobaculum halophilum]QLG26439.1 hypothetical protein HUG10_02295 [Halobaculum halophilum]
MPVDIRDHPDAPSIEELREFTLVPVSREEIETRVGAGEELRELNLREERNDVYVQLNSDPDEPGSSLDIGMVLYRLVQLFGTPQVPGFEAGGDVSDRDDTTFKYLFRLIREGDIEGELPEEWLVTVFDNHVDLGVALAGWSGDGVDPSVYGDDVALVSLALATNVVTEPVTCAYEDKWY